MLEQAQVGGELAEGLRDAGEERKHARVDLAGIGLARNPQAAREARLLGDGLVQGLDLGVIAIEQLQEAGLGAGGALNAQEGQALVDGLELFQIEEQILDPQGGALAYRGELGGLEMGEPQGGHVLVCAREAGERGDHAQQAAADQVHAGAGLDEIGVVGDIGRSGAQVDDAGGLGALQAVGMDMGHHVVADGFLALFRLFEVDVRLMGLEIRDLLFRDGQAQLPFRLGQQDPQLPPGLELVLGRKDETHARGGVAFDEGIFVLLDVVHGLRFRADGGYGDGWIGTQK